MFVIQKAPPGCDVKSFKILCALVLLWRSEFNLLESVLSFYLVNPKVQAQTIVRLSDKGMNHLLGPKAVFES